MGTQVVVLVGNLGKDAELRLLPNSGKPILNFDLPIDIGFGEKKETMWVRCTLFGDRAEKLESHLTKGKGVMVTGEFRMPRIYEGKNGQSVSMELNVNQLSFVGGAKDSSNGNGTPVAASADVGDGENIPW